MVDGIKKNKTIVLSVTGIALTICLVAFVGYLGGKTACRFRKPVKAQALIERLATEFHRAELELSLKRRLSQHEDPHRG